MIDDMNGLYTHASEAFAAGQRSGRDEMFRSSLAELSKISIEQESGPVNGQEAQITTRGFHVAEACCKAVRAVKTALDQRRRSV